MSKALLALLLAAHLANGASAQLADLLVIDSGADTLWRCVDSNHDGDFNDAGEVAAAYASPQGPVTLTSPNSVRSGIDGDVFFTDTDMDSVFRARDYNGDGDDYDEGELRRWFDGRVGGNPAGLLLPFPVGAVRDRLSETWYVASSNLAGVGVDVIARVRDHNLDGDVNDPGEASAFWTAPGSPATDTVPRAIEIGPDGKLYLLDNPTSGINSRGIYRMVDWNGDGDVLDVDEVAPFFIPSFVLTPSLSALKFGKDGWFYCVDTSNDIVWRFRDQNGDGDAADAGERSVYWTMPTPSVVNDLCSAPDGTLYALESQGAQRIFHLVDLDGDDSIGAGEAIEVYNSSTSGGLIVLGRGIDTARPNAGGDGYCFGDGTATACPCGNAGASGRGCANSILALGARLETLGVASVSSDSLRLAGSGMPNSAALYFQGTTQTNGGAGTTLGDGLRCAGGTVLRLATQVNAGGYSHYPELGESSVSARGLVTVGNVHMYQVWYRNAASYCTASTFNLSNGVRVAWRP